MSACEVVALLPALCLAGFVPWLSSLPPNGRLVLLLDVLGLGGCFGSVPVVPVVLGRHGMLWWGIAPLMVETALAVLGLPLGMACPGEEKSFENWYDMPCPALQPALHAQSVILYILVPFGFPFGLACANSMYTPVGGKSPSVRYPLRCIPVFPMGAPGPCACVVVRCSCSCPLASCLGWVRGCGCQKKDVLDSCPNEFDEILQVLMLKSQTKAAGRARTGYGSNQ